jgi:hypothetical protein
MLLDLSMFQSISLHVSIHCASYSVLQVQQYQILLVTLPQEQVKQSMVKHQSSALSFSSNLLSYKSCHIASLSSQLFHVSKDRQLAKQESHSFHTLFMVGFIQLTHSYSFSGMVEHSSSGSFHIMFFEVESNDINIRSLKQCLLHKGC